jgi:hypothetical protein
MSAFHRLHVFESNGEVEVWLDSDAGRRDGVCLASGTDRPGVLVQARVALADALEKVDQRIAQIRHTAVQS